MKKYIWLFLIAVFFAPLALKQATAEAVEVLKIKHVISVYSDEKGAGLARPDGVGCGGGSLVVSDTGNGRLLLYTLQEGKISGGTEMKSDQLEEPLRARINSKKQIFVLDGKKRRISLFAEDGSFRGLLEPSGLPGTTPVPRSFFIDREDNLYLLDLSSGSVLILDPEGKYVRHIALPEDGGFFSDVAVDFRGNILLLDSLKGQVYAAQKDAEGFSPLTNSRPEGLKFPTSISSDSSGRLYILDQNGGEIFILGPDGTLKAHLSKLGWKEGELYYPSDLCLDPAASDLFIADRNNNRVQYFKLELQ